MTVPSLNDRSSWLALEQATLVLDSMARADDRNSIDAPCGAISPEEMDLYVAGKADLDLGLRVAAHITECDACRTAVSEALLRREPLNSPEPPGQATAPTTMARGQLDALFSTVKARHVAGELPKSVEPRPEGAEATTEADRGE